MLVIWSEKGCKRSFQPLSVFFLFLQLGEVRSEWNCTLYDAVKQPPNTSLLQF